MTIDKSERKEIDKIFWSIAPKIVPENQWRAFVFKQSIGATFMCQKEYDLYKMKILSEMLKIPFINTLIRKETIQESVKERKHE